jgi:hypothetical protein
VRELFRIKVPTVLEGVDLNVAGDRTTTSIKKINADDCGSMREKHWGPWPQNPHFPRKKLQGPLFWAKASWAGSWSHLFGWLFFIIGDRAIALPWLLEKSNGKIIAAVEAQPAIDTAMAIPAKPAYSVRIWWSRETRPWWYRPICTPLRSERKENV